MKNTANLTERISTPKRNLDNKAFSVNESHPDSHDGRPGG